MTYIFLAPSSVNDVQLTGMQTKPVAIAETSLFIRQAAAIWDDDERQAFVDYIAFNPESGDVIPGTGGVRKVRWSRPGSGKRGGVRVIYFYYHTDAPLYLFAAYAKSQREDMTPEEKKAVANIAADLKQQFATKRRS